MLPNPRSGGASRIQGHSDTHAHRITELLGDWVTCGLRAGLRMVFPTHGGLWVLDWFGGGRRFGGYFTEPAAAPRIEIRR